MSAERKYAITFTTTERLLLNVDLAVPEGASVQDSITQMLKGGIWGDSGAGSDETRWHVPGSQIAKVTWKPHPVAPVAITGAAADPNGGTGGR